MTDYEALVRRAREAADEDEKAGEGWPCFELLRELADALEGLLREKADRADQAWERDL